MLLVVEGVRATWVIREMACAGGCSGQSSKSQVAVVPSTFCPAPATPLSSCPSHKVSESAFASCLARHNSYVREATNHYDASYSAWIHDLKSLLLRFAHERSFSSESGGGGPQSNVHVVPYLLHVALYVLNT